MQSRCEPTFTHCIVLLQYFWLNHVAFTNWSSSIATEWNNPAIFLSLHKPKLQPRLEQGVFLLDWLWPISSTYKSAHMVVRETTVGTALPWYLEGLASWLLFNGLCIRADAARWQADRPDFFICQFELTSVHYLQSTAERGGQSILASVIWNSLSSSTVKTW